MAVFVPFRLIATFNMTARPILFVILATIIFALMGGTEKRPNPQASTANTIAFISVVLLGMVTLALSFFLGAGTNAMATNLATIIRNLWEIGLVVILGEFIRFKLTKKLTRRSDNWGMIAIIVLTVSLAFGQIVNLYILFDNATISEWIVTAFRPLTISIMASFFAIKGSFLAAVLVSFVFTMITHLSPIIPNVSTMMFSLMVSGLALISIIILHLTTSETSKAERAKEKRMAKYEKKSFTGWFTTAGIIGFLLAFFMGAFPIYPIVVLTGSMSPTFERGSIVFVQSVPEGEAFIRVGEGYVIHFLSRTGVPYVHRVIDFVHDTDGEREYITQGDASYLIDPHPVPQEDVLGVVRMVLPFFGYPYVWLRTIFR